MGPAVGAVSVPRRVVLRPADPAAGEKRQGRSLVKVSAATWSRSSGQPGGDGGLGGDPGAGAGGGDPSGGAGGPGSGVGDPGALAVRAAQATLLAALRPAGRPARDPPDRVNRPDRTNVCGPSRTYRDNKHAGHSRSACYTRDARLPGTPGASGFPGPTGTPGTLGGGLPGAPGTALAPGLRAPACLRPSTLRHLRDRR